MTTCGVCGWTGDTDELVCEPACPTCGGSGCLDLASDNERCDDAPRDAGGVVADCERCPHACPDCATPVDDPAPVETCPHGRPVDASFDPCPACAQGDPAPGTPEHAADYLLGRHAGYGLSEITYWKGVLAAYAQRCTEALRTERDDLRARLDEARAEVARLAARKHSTSPAVPRPARGSGGCRGC